MKQYQCLMYEVRSLLHKQNSRSAAGPDLVSSLTIKWCGSELASVYNVIFKMFLTKYKMSDCLNQLL